MVTTIVAIITLMIGVALINKISPLKFCPICAAVSLTWLGLIAGMFLGWLPATAYQLPASILMGGTVVGLMYKLEFLIKPKFVLGWKTAFVSLGFLAMDGLLTGNWLQFLASMILIGLVTVLSLNQFKRTKPSLPETGLEKDLESCC